jgi:RND family efflux transporter MFP subunit
MVSFWRDKDMIRFFRSLTPRVPVHSASLVLGLLLLAFSPQASRAQSSYWVSGITQPVKDVTLSAPLAGIIGERRFKEGDRVGEGDVMIELKKDLEELEVKRRKLVMDLRRTELESMQALYKKNSISVSREELDKKTSEFHVAEVEYNLAKEQLRRRQVTAPFAGRIAEYFLEVGESCQAQEPLVRVVDTRQCQFVSHVDAQQGHGLAEGQEVNLEVQAGNRPVTFTGTISFVSPVVDPASGLMKVKVEFENPENRIRPGVAGRMQVR